MLNKLGGDKMSILSPQILNSRLIRYILICLFLHSLDEDVRSLCLETTMGYLKDKDCIYAQGLACILLRECQKLHLDISSALTVADAFQGEECGDFGQLVRKELLK